MNELLWHFEVGASWPVDAVGAMRTLQVFPCKQRHALQISTAQSIEGESRSLG